MWAMQRNFMYVPVNSIQTPEHYGLSDFSVITLEPENGVKLQAWYKKALDNYPTIVFFHGNGGNLAHRSGFFDLLSKGGFGILALDYRGYGASTGSPSEQGFYSDARAAINYAVTDISIPPEKIIIYGESIGTGVAVQMATEYKTAALILQSPFSSMKELVKNYYPWLPVGLLLKDRYDSNKKIAKVKSPILLFHGDEDTIIPIEYGKKLFAASPEPKKSVYFSGKGHNDLDISELTKEIVEFSVSNNLIKYSN